MRDEDTPSSRRNELNQISLLIELIGKRLGYNLRKDDKVLLWEEDDKIVRVFHVLASALIGRTVNENQYPVEKCLLVLPGGRAPLAAYKQERDPVLAEKMRGWKIVKFRLLRALTEIPVLTRETFEEQITSDPVEKAEGQLMMF